MSAPGTLARFVKPELLMNLFEDEHAYQKYLDFEAQFDSEATILGQGTERTGGLLVAARKHRLEIAPFGPQQ